jgi:hypothetical protein
MHCDLAHRHRLAADLDPIDAEGRAAVAEAGKARGSAWRGSADSGCDNAAAAEFDRARSGTARSAQV